jgi:hypothetical protein
MNRLLDLLADRKMRAAAQVLAVAAIGAAAALAFVDHSVARAGSVLLIGGVALVALKISLVLVQRQQALSAAVRNGFEGDRQLVTLRAEVDESRVATEAVRAEVDRLASTVDPLTDAIAHHHGLIRRTEPAVAEFSTMRHEVLYLREAVERLQSRLDS